jgi:hypothetical protein
MNRDEMLKLVDDLYAATGVGDFDRAEKMLTDDFFVTEADGLPMAGVYRGKSALRELYTRVMSLMEIASLDRIETTTGEDYAVTILSIRFRDPALAPAELCEVFRFRGNQVCEIKPYYFDPETVRSAAGVQSAE